ncbi:MAG: bifunctional metallophosphatase/5'-nucleotidase [Paludibacteraceae bacterium]
MSKNKLFPIVALCVALGLTACNNQPRQLVVLCSNDTHSQVEPCADGMGGYAARKHFIDSVRRVNNNVLLLDAGDIFQGTPYFNMFDGRLEIEAYNLMGYEATTFGNHEFDKGIDTLAARVRQAQFPYICCNYDVSGTSLDGLTQPYVVFDKQGLRVGVLGLGVDPQGLILADNFGGVRYTDPIEAANRYAAVLRHDEQCDFVIALSHLGFAEPGSISDSLVAVNSTDIDLIVGGHTHEVRGVFEIPNRNGRMITVMQTSKSGKEIDKVVIAY